MIDQARCMGQKDPTVLGGERCQKEAPHETSFGRMCGECFKRLKEAAKSPNTLLGILRGVREEKPS